MGDVREDDEACVARFCPERAREVVTGSLLACIHKRTEWHVFYAHSGPLHILWFTPAAEPGQYTVLGVVSTAPGALSFAKTASDSPGEDPWATGGLSTPDDRRADGPPLYRKAVGMLRRSGPAQKDVIVRAGRMTAETTNSRRGSTLVAGRGPGMLD